MARLGQCRASRTSGCSTPPSLVRDRIAIRNLPKTRRPSLRHSATGESEAQVWPPAHLSETRRLAPPPRPALPELHQRQMPATWRLWRAQASCSALVRARGPA